MAIASNAKFVSKKGPSENTPARGATDFFEPTASSVYYRRYDDAFCQNPVTNYVLPKEEWLSPAISLETLEALYAASPNTASPTYFIGIPECQRTDLAALVVAPSDPAKWFVRCSPDSFPDRFDTETIDKTLRGFAAKPLINRPQISLRSTSAHIRRMLHDQYGDLGRLTGREARLREWTKTPAEAAETLVQESVAEGDVERLAEVSAILSSLGTPGREWILFGLSFENARAEFYEAMFRALRWIGDLTGEQVARAEGLVLRHIQSPEIGIRIAAGEATSVLTHGAAKAILSNALKEEREDEVVVTIQERLAELDE